MKPIGSVRRAQLITTYGVGAIVAVDDESVMVAGLDHWPSEGEEVLEPRLSIGGKALRLPPGGDAAFGNDKRGDVPVVRFPRWYYCPDKSCRRLGTWSSLSADLTNRCRFCDGEGLVPSRFVAVCEQGHIEDFPFFSWVHPSEDRPEGTHELTLQVDGSTSSLAGIVVGCRTCGVSRSMDGAFDKQALVGVKACGGQRPWLTKATVDCGRRLRALQRGASNVWFPQVRSALSIPPWSDGLQQFVQKHWGTLGMELDPGTMRQVVTKMVDSHRVDYSAEEVLSAMEDRKGGSNTARDESEIRREEYQALCQGREGGQEAQFEAEQREVPVELEEELDLLTVVSRLREVRAFVGFSRLQPVAADVPGDGDSEANICEITLEEDWYPAIPVLGEGIFMRLRASALDEWEDNGTVTGRVDELNERWKQSYMFDENELTPRFVLAHTLAHALIDQWSLSGGYPAASLRERIYVEGSRAGILIYTASSDSAGSLGGVIAQAEPERLTAGFNEAIRRYAWCSSDPVCSETRSQGAEGLNMAACHSCALLPETSCEHRNGLLDRALLVGTPEDRSFGFFRNRIGS